MHGGSGMTAAMHLGVGCCGWGRSDWGVEKRALYLLILSDWGGMISKWCLLEKNNDTS